MEKAALQQQEVEKAVQQLQLQQEKYTRQSEIKNIDMSQASITGADKFLSALGVAEQWLALPPQVIVEASRLTVEIFDWTAHGGASSPTTDGRARRSPRNSGGTSPLSPTQMGEERATPLLLLHLKRMVELGGPISNEFLDVRSVHNKLSATAEVDGHMVIYRGLPDVVVLSEGLGGDAVTPLYSRYFISSIYLFIPVPTLTAIALTYARVFHPICTPAVLLPWILRRHWPSITVIGRRWRLRR